MLYDEKIINLAVSFYCIIYKKAIEAHKAWVESHKEVNQSEGIKQAV